ncbi:TlpA disulfide reductase family protein [Marinifilum caeruleilacunae]|uniref:TlpA family protein disulfide reductase n=1 Tax=Marinifilum caeruleilacunae TaxID=2499076 RepID=A0ABX1WXI9_9BACT|nr:TlpA disulfide reductase family protein [Marinifilum caeruleilacunae]NOU60631.1 TlpA family protein disulfide reductase [Marinifilum caeruleilacunae]
MKQRLFYLLIVLISISLNGNSQDFKTMDYEALKPSFHQQNDTTYVINFWAMWCKPCVEELPEFEHIRKSYENKKVKILLVSLDFGSNVKERLTKFLKKKNINAEVVILDDPDSNAWIGKVDQSWDGALPATVVYKKENRKFFAGKITYSELAETIDNFNR